MDRYAKAIIAVVTTALIALGTYLSGDQTLSDVTASQWIGVAIALLAELGLVWGVPNKADPPVVVYPRSENP